MYKITKVEQLTETIYLMDVVAPRVANKCLPGQFVIVRGSEDGERIPLTICDYSREDGTITIVFQVVGAATEMMKNKKAGDSFADFVGPLGCPSEFCKEDIEELKKKKILFVAGGVGTAPVYPQVKWLHEQGIEADATMIGLRLTTVGISSSFVSLHTNFIMIIGPMATHTSYLLPASTSFWISFVTTPLLPYEPSSVVIYRLPATFFILSSINVFRDSL